MSPAASGLDSSWWEDLLGSSLPGAFTGTARSRLDISGSYRSPTNEALLTALPVLASSLRNM